MVSRQLISHTPGYEKPHRNIHVTQKRSHVYSFMKTKTHYNKLNRSCGGCGWRNCTSTMDQTFPGSTRKSCTNNNNKPRQQEHYTVIRKWQNIKLKKDTSYQYMLFLHSRQNQKRRSQVAYCLTTNMLENFFTKTLQGIRFKKMRNVIRNLPNTDKANATHRNVLENERRNKEKNEHKNQKQNQKYRCG